MDVKYQKVHNCVVCGSLVEKVIDLPEFPITDIYVDVPEIGIVDQGLGVCPKCGHVQLTSAVDPDILYGRAYAFRTTVGGSTGVNDDLLKLGFTKFNRIVDVGCNDCYLLNSLRDKSPNLIGIDPILAGREAEFSDSQLTAIGDFVENVDLPKEDNTLYLTSHVMEHLPNPRAMLEKLLTSAGKDCLFVFQFPGFDSLMEDYRFDQVYNHHLHYFSLHSISYLLSELGCEIVNYKVNPHYWGTLRIMFTPSGKSNFGHKFSPYTVLDRYNQFSARMEMLGEYVRSFRERKFGYGAALQVPVLSYHLKNDFSDFECIVDDDDRKDGKYFLNLPVVIEHSSKVCINGSVVLVTAHNFSRKIIPKLVEMNPKRIILPHSGI